MRTPTRWQPYVQQDEPSDALEFVLTPRERDVAALASLHIKAHVRRLNRLDTAQAVADELVRREML